MTKDVLKNKVKKLKLTVLGFTLIELLAVIVILAIVALIATPIILGIIKDTKEEANKRSVEMYAKSVENAIMKYQLGGKKISEGYYDSSSDGKLITNITEGININVEYEGNPIKCDIIKFNKNNILYLNNCNINGMFVDYEYGKLNEMIGNQEEDKENYWNRFLNTDVPSNSIVSLSFLDYIKIPEGYKSKDCSKKQDKSVICWWTKNKESGYYDMYVGAEGGVIAPKDSSYLFKNLGYFYSIPYEYRIKTLDLTNFDTTLVENMEGMFSNISSIDTLNLGNNFNTSNVKNMKSMFYNLDNLKTLDLGEKFDTSKVTDMSYMFSSVGYYSITNLDLGEKFDTSKVTDMSYMFNKFASTAPLKTFNLGEKFDTSKVTDMSYMFNDSFSSLPKLDLREKFDTSKVTNMSHMFSSMGGSQSFESLNLGEKFDTSKVTDMSYMFSGIGGYGFLKLDLGENFNTSNVVDMNHMFYAIGDLSSLNLGEKFDTSKVTDMSYMFAHIGSFRFSKLNLGDKFDISNVENMEGMFINLGNSSWNDTFKILNLNQFSIPIKNNVNIKDIFKNVGREEIFTNVEVSNQNVKEWIINNSDVNGMPEFWNTNNIITVKQ